MAVQYPRIDDSMLVPFRAIEALLKRNPQMLEVPECPYSATTRGFLTKLFATADETEPVKSQYSEDDLETEIATLYSELKRAGLQVSSVDPKDKIAMLKTSSDMLTKMVALKERMMNLKSMSAFQRTVIEILEGVLTPAQRSEFVERMSQYVQGNSAAVLGQVDLGDPASAEAEGPGA